jgi:excisionase family DNA binding protein
MPKFLTSGEAAAVLRVSPYTLRAWARAGRVPCNRVPGSRKLLFSEATLAEVAQGASRSDNSPPAAA